MKMYPRLDTDECKYVFKYIYGCMILYMPNDS